MVEPITTGVILGALALKAAEKAGELAVEKGWENKSALGKFLKDHILGEEITQLNLNDDRAIGKLEGQVEEKLKANPELIPQLEDIIKALPPTIQIKRNEQNVTGSGNISLQDVSGGDININK